MLASQTLPSASLLGPQPPLPPLPADAPQSPDLPQPPFLPQPPLPSQPSRAQSLFALNPSDEPPANGSDRPDSSDRADSILSTTAHRPWPLPSTRWKMTQRWNDLLFAHWPVPAAQLNPLLPSNLVVDTFDGSAWVGVVPFWMDQIRMSGLPAIPGLNRFPELNLRTYVREPNTNMGGVYFFSLDAGNPLAVAFARLVYKLPYYWSKMSIDSCGEREFCYSSQRRLVKEQAGFRARYRSLGQASDKHDLEKFLTERYALYTANRSGAVFKGNIHHLPWPLERAEADFELNELPRAHGITLPDTPPLLHYSRELVVYIWALEPLVSPLRNASPVAVEQGAGAGA